MEGYDQTSTAGLGNRPGPKPRTALRNPWQFQEAFNFPVLQDVAALQDLWILAPNSFSQVTKLLAAVSSYNARVDSVSLYQLNESTVCVSRYSADMLLRLREIGTFVASAITEIEGSVGTMHAAELELFVFDKNNAVNIPKAA
jgi:hypothetical protein